MNRLAKLSCLELEERKILKEIARLLNREDKANRVLDLIQFPQEARPDFRSSSTPLHYWHEVCRLLEAGILEHEEDGLRALLTAVAEEFPRNEKFRTWRRREEGPDPSAILKRLVVEIVWIGRPLHMKDVPAATLVVDFRDQTLAKAAAAKHLEPARVLHLCNGKSAPLHLRATLAQAGIRDGDTLRVSRLVDDENGPDDVRPVLREELIRFYAERIHHVKGDTLRARIDWASRRAITELKGLALVEALVTAAFEQRGWVDLAILAAVHDLNDDGVRAVLGRLAWYGGPGELAPEAWVLLQALQREELERVWQTLNEASCGGQGKTRAIRNPVSGS